MYKQLHEGFGSTNGYEVLFRKSESLKQFKGLGILGCK